MCFGVLVFRCLVSRCLDVWGVQGVQVFMCHDISENQKGDQGGGPKMAKNEYGVKLDIFKITQIHTRGMAALVDREPRQHRTRCAMPEKASWNTIRHSGTPC